MEKQKHASLLVYLVLGLGIVCIALPLYLTVVTAFKPQSDAMRNFFALPKSFYLENFKNVIAKQGYFNAVFNTIYITAGSLLGMILFLPLASFPIARSMTTSRFYKFLYYFFLIGLFIPFQVKMMPLVKWASTLGMMNTTGLIIIYNSCAVCEGIFLFVGFISTIPVDLEEAANIDGAGPVQTYTRVVFPLLKPMLATVVIRNGLWIWNDFFMPLLILNKSNKFWTLTLFQYNFNTEFMVDYSMTFATCFLSMIPVIIVYLLVQKQIIGGLTNGAVKG